MCAGLRITKIILEGPQVTAQRKNGRFINVNPDARPQLDKLFKWTVIDRVARDLRDMASE